MSAIGGIVDLRAGEIEFEAVNKMRIAMTLRGRKRSSAYIGKNASLVYNSSKKNAFCEDEDKQPAIFERAGNEYVLCIDSDRHSSSSVFERYHVDGIDLLGALDGDFALALYDDQRKMLMLARDRGAKRPLYYRIKDGKIYFASEIRGVLCAIGEGANISREILSLHLSSPMGIYRAANIYTDICEVLPGECLLFSALGMSRFRYRDIPRPPLQRTEASKRRKVIEPYAFFSEQGVEDALADALIAFEYPQFDLRMPIVCDMLSKAGKRGEERVLYYDPNRRQSLSYAVERDERLGSFYGVSAVGVAPKNILKIGVEREIYSYLCRKFCLLTREDILLLENILCKRKLEKLASNLTDPRKKEDTEQELRILGMLCQTVMWARSQKLIIKSTQPFDQSALSMI